MSVCILVGGRKNGRDLVGREFWNNWLSENHNQNTLFKKNLCFIKRNGKEHKI